MANFSFYLQLVVYTFVLITALTMGIAIIRHSQNRLARTLFIFFMSIVLGTFFSVFSRLSPNMDFKITGTILAAIFTGYALIHLTFFLLLLIHSTKELSINKQIIWSILYLFIMLILLFIPEGVRFEFNEDGAYVPVWSLLFIIYGIVVQQSLFMYDLYLIIKLINTMKDERTKTKFKNTNIAIIILDVILIGTYLVNFFNNAIFRIIFAVIGLTVFLALYLFYDGLVRHIKKTTYPK